jgi:hypothetical protein
MALCAADERKRGEICVGKYLGFDPAVAGHCKLKVFVAGRRKVEINLGEGLRIAAFHFDVCYKTIQSKTYFYSK